MRLGKGNGPNEKENLCVWDSCARLRRRESEIWMRKRDDAGGGEGDEKGERGMQLQFVPLTVRGKNGHCLAGEKRIELL